MAFKLIAIAINASLISNIILTKFLGICPFMGVSKKQSTAFGMGLAVTFVLTMAVIITWFIYKFLLLPFRIEFLQTLAFILVIAALVQLVEIILKKVSPDLYQALGIYLPLITTNCAILGSAVLVVKEGYGFWESVDFALFTSVGFTLVIITFSAIREALELKELPKVFKGVPIAFITAGLMSLAFMGFSGLDKVFENMGRKHVSVAHPTKTVVAKEKGNGSEALAASLEETAVFDHDQGYKLKLEGNVADITITVIPDFPVQVKVYDVRELSSEGMDLKALAGNLMERFKQLRMTFDDYLPDSEITRLGQAKPNIKVSLSDEMYDALSLSKEVYEETGGLFDPTVKPLIRLWKGAQRKGKLPSPEEVKAVLSQVGFKYLELSEGHGKTLTKTRRVELDLGGIAKGLMSDLILDYLHGRGVKRALVNMGGDMSFYDDEGRGFEVAIADPTNRLDIIAILSLKVKRGAVATSGSYWRWYEVGGKRYSHIVNPKTGMPVETDVLSATAVVIGSRYAGGYADAYATALYILGRKGYKTLMSKAKVDLKGVLIWKQGGRAIIGYTPSSNLEVRVVKEGVMLEKI